MLSLRFYYALKPFLPWRMRMALRRIPARRKRERFAAVWPINESTSQPPAGWPGWPEGKKFAFVITHDIEGPEGLAKCRQLAELEMAHGVRSCFNFIPEGPYKVPPEFRAWLTENGFEVGVHDLNHDGKLFTSQRGFMSKAQRINHYLREWQARGYRSGFMLRNLDWLHELAIGYDSSTFDTDPFEPQPDGAGTIFPYWIPSPDGSGAKGQELSAKGSAPQLSAFSFQPSASSSQPSAPPQRDCAPSVALAKEGYVELPYTLPQDSTLFLLLQEKSPEIWLHKLDWVAKHGGMALVNVHPDYMNFTNEPGTSREYPASFFADLLRHVAARHAGHYWNPLPRDLADWFRQNCSAGGGQPGPQPLLTRPQPEADYALRHGLAGKRAAVLLYSEYPSDPRPRRAAEAMIEAGMEVDLFCLRGSESEPHEQTVNRVRIFRLPLAHKRGGKWTYLRNYSRFILSSFFFVTRMTLRKKYDLVHVHNMPDVLVFSALFYKLGGGKVILDLHDPMPEVMMTIYGLAENRLPIRILRLLEKWSIGFSDGVLTVNRACHVLFSSRSCPPGKVRVVMNSPDEGIFKLQEPGSQGDAPKPGQPFVIMYHGSIVERHGLDLAVTALQEVRQTHPQVELRIYGRENPFLHQVMQTVQAAGLQSSVRYMGPKNLEQIVKAIRECDVGIIPNRRSLFTELNTPTRIFEYLSQAKPLIAPHAQGILDYFGPEDLYYFKLGDAKDLANTIRQILQHPENVAATVRRGQAVYQRHCWSNERHRFLDAVADVLAPTGRPVLPPSP